MLYGWRLLNHIQKAENIEFNESQCNASPCGIWVYRTLFAFPFHSCSTTTSRNCSFFLVDPTFYFGTIPLIPLSLIALLFALLLVSNTRPHSNRYIVTVNSLASTVFGIYLIHQNQSIGQLTWILASKTSPSHPSGMMSMTLTSGIILIAVFLILAFIAWIFDNIVVHPIQNTLIHVLEKLMINPK